MVLEGRLCPSAARCRHRRPSRCMRARPSPASCMHLYPIDGAVHRRGKGDSAWNARDATWSMVIAGIDPDPGMAPALKKWATDYWKAVHPFDLGGAYPNFMMDDEGEERVQASFGDNYPRLAALKTQVRPGQPFPRQPEHPPDHLDAVIGVIPYCLVHLAVSPRIRPVGDRAPFELRLQRLRCRRARARRALSCSRAASTGREPHPYIAGWRHSSTRRP